MSDTLRDPAHDAVVTPIIRPARLHDADAIVDMAGRLAADTGMKGPAVTAAQIADHGFGPQAFLVLWIAEDDGAPAGLLLGNAVLSTGRGRRGLYVGDLYVAPTLRGRGTGAALLRSAVRGGGYGFVKLEALNTNLRAQGFYQRLGFTASEGDRTWMLEPAATAALLAEPGD